jgi:hypothetical protein
MVRAIRDNIERCVSALFDEFSDGQIWSSRWQTCSTERVHPAGVAPTARCGPVVACVFCIASTVLTGRSV